jgi:hypothetical protein
LKYEVFENLQPILALVLEARRQPDSEEVEIVKAEDWECCVQRHIDRHQGNRLEDLAIESPRRERRVLAGFCSYRSILCAEERFIPVRKSS